MCLDFSGRPKEAPAGCLPWFSIPRRESGGATVIFGHWAALGFRTGPDFIALDSGCVWGGKLTAVRLEDGAVFQVGLRDA
jgi:bis(5'-nucleosyl)-tetraphosphatase (symmetrical)